MFPVPLHISLSLSNTVVCDKLLITFFSRKHVFTFHNFLLSGKRLYQKVSTSKGHDIDADYVHYLK